MDKKLGIIGIILIVIAIIASVFAVITKDKEAQTNNESVSKIAVTINVFDKDGTNIYEQNIETDKKYLIDVLKDIPELKLVTEDSEYGAYITSIMDISQGDNYYWTYYIGEEYATIGVSSCKIEEGKIYNLKIETFNQEV